MSTQRRRRILFSLLPILGFLLLLQTSLSQPKQSPKTIKTPKWHIHHHLKVAHSVCEGTLYPQICVSTLSTIPEIATKTIPEIISVTVNHTVHEVHTSASNCTGIRKKLSKYLDPLQKRALDDCLELFDETVSELKTALSDLSKTSTSKRYHDLQTLLSGAMTNQYTCLDGFAYSNGKVREEIEKGLYDISHRVSNSLAMLKKLKIPKGTSVTSKRRSDREAFPGYGKIVDGFPRWVTKKDRRLLQSSTSTIDFDLVVAKDGTGNFTTISEAVDAAPNSSTTRFVIYIKTGAYFENVDVDKKKTMLMFIGDGIGKTWIKADRNVVDGWTTFRSATVAVVGNGFIARDISFENYAGPSKHQAVALRSGSDLSAFYRCSFVGYQDTLYVHSLRQFYRECDIYGTIDFIFGNAAVVLQNCNLYARKPNENQKNIYTAQGREDPNQNTGISIQNAKVAAAADLIPVQSSFKTYLGRPWKEYSRTLFLTSYMEDLIDPAGWLEWDGDFALSTLYYREYKNTGPGSNTTNRVTWPGYKVTDNSTEVNQFSVANFIDGNDWLSETQIPFTLTVT